MPKQTGAIIDATAAADPELEPPGVKSLLCGFVVNPGALEKAKQLDNENNVSQLGIPFGIKDIIDASNTPTGFGTNFYQNNVPMRDAASVAVAKQSGCIFIGKTVSTELGHRAPGLTTNPHNVKQLQWFVQKLLEIIPV